MALGLVLYGFSCLGPSAVLRRPHTLHPSERPRSSTGGPPFLCRPTATSDQLNPLDLSPSKRVRTASGTTCLRLIRQSLPSALQTCRRSLAEPPRWSPIGGDLCQPNVRLGVDSPFTCGNAPREHLAPLVIRPGDQVVAPGTIRRSHLGRRREHAPGSCYTCYADMTHSNMCLSWSARNTGSAGRRRDVTLRVRSTDCSVNRTGASYDPGRPIPPARGGSPHEPC
jgi:hypothetical protein